MGGSFEHAQSADANGYWKDDAVFKFLTKDDFQSAMGERKHQKRHHEVIHEPSSLVNKNPENAEQKKFVHQCEIYPYASESVHA